VLKSFVSVLKSKFGTVHVNLGEPIVLDEIWTSTIRAGVNRPA